MSRCSSSELFLLTLSSWGDNIPTSICGVHSNTLWQCVVVATLCRRVEGAAEFANRLKSVKFKPTVGCKSGGVFFAHNNEWR